MIKDFCPVCKEEVEYEEYKGDCFCTICGRTKGAAEAYVNHIASSERKKKRSLLFDRIGCGCFTLLGLVGLILYLISGRSTNRFGGVGWSRVIGRIVIFTLLFVIFLVIGKISSIIRKKHKSD